MYSKFIRFLFALTGFSPILLSVWIVFTFQHWDEVYIYITPSNMHMSFWERNLALIKNNWALLVFGCFVAGAYANLKFAREGLTPRPIALKGSKPVDFNFAAPLLSYIAPFFKFALKDANDVLFLSAIFGIWVILALIYMNAYQFNVVVRLLGYRHYEVQTTGEISFLMLSKKKIINRNDVKVYVPLTDHMILNAT